jgi:formylglycine-generating enzyme required for sulfatase activity/SpoVK/Ycf46/Vps4 family AAA+-type ATPase
MVVSKVVGKFPTTPGVEKVSQPDNSFSNQILILFSAPLLNEDLSPVENLSIQAEIDAIALVLEQISHPLAVEIVAKVATSETLQDVFSSRSKPLIIHFIGHGMRSRDGIALVLEDGVGIARSFSKEELSIALSNRKQPPCQLVLLNACHSEKLAQAFVKAGVPHVVAINAEDKILDVAARCFSRKLYQALFNQDSIADAFLASCNAVKLDDELKKLFNSKTYELGVNFDEAFKFRLLPQTSHNLSLNVEPADSHQVTHSQWSNTNIPPNDPDFIGRRQAIHQVIKELVESEKRCLALHGMGGIGKTALAHAIGRWLHERNRYQDGVWFISLRDTNDVGTLIIKVKQRLELSSIALERELRHRRLFLILDDLDKLIETQPNELIELLNSLLEQCADLRLLLTSRDSLVQDLNYCYQAEVCSMGASETREIFQKYAPAPEKWGNNEDIAADFNLLVKFLDGYPLAIKLAASYMTVTQSTLKILCEDLDIEPLEILDSYSPEQRKERSLRLTLDRSFEMLSIEGQEIFSWMAFFPSGLNRDLARAIWGRNGNKALLELFKFSMAEKSDTASDWRMTLPAPARTYAESKLPGGRGIDYLTPQVLDFYYHNFCEIVTKLFDRNNLKQGQQLLLQENSNLILFLEWGYDQEISSDRICRSARITALLSPYWRSIEPDRDPLMRLELALAAATRNQDRAGADLVRNAIAAVSAREPFRDVRSLRQENDDLKSFELGTVTVNRRGQEINRETKQAQYYTETLADDVDLDLVYIPGGTFIMGSPTGEGFDHEQPQHEVTVPPFFMGKYPITQAQWQAISSLEQEERHIRLDPSYFKGDERPVEQVNWYEAVEFCARLSKLSGRQYRLPSEAEWEYTCRAGTTTPFYFGATMTGELANYNASETYANEPKGQYRNETNPIGQFFPNAFGLYDLHGSVWEWCLDYWYPDYRGAPTDGSAWSSDRNNDTRLLRGGSFFSLPRNCRSASRRYIIPDHRYCLIGFRVVCEIPRTL